VLLDVREPNEWALGHIPGAMHIPRGVMESAIETRVPREHEVVIYCASGNRSALAADVLQQMGYEKVSSMSGGIRGWSDAGGDIEA
jgi:rhodanese-related sulfurtransferase